MFPRGVFFSTLLGRRCYGSEGDLRGRLEDMGVLLGEPFPKVVSAWIKRADGSTEPIAWSRFKMFVAGTFVLETQGSGLSEAPQPCLPGTERIGEGQSVIRLRRDLLDRQIVDTRGHKVVRINDLRLAEVSGETRLIAADVGLSGLIRRLGLARPVERAVARVSGRLPDTLIAWRDLELIVSDLDSAGVRVVVPHEKILRLHPADIAEIIEELHARERTAIFHALDPETAAETLQEVEPETQTAILAQLPKEKASQILGEMAPDDAADLLGELHEAKAEELLGLMEADDAQEVRTLLEYREGTAGALMTTEFIAFPETLTADETINQLRKLAPEAETIYYVYVIDQDGKLIGVISLRSLIVSDPNTALARIMERDVISVDVDTSSADVAEAIDKYDLLALPVVDRMGKLVGIITVDDVLDLLMSVPKRRKRLKRHQ